MKTQLFPVLLLFLIPLQADEGNPKIDYPGFMELSKDLATVRDQHRVSEKDFMKMAAEKNTVILDSRSKAKFDKIHVKGAIHLNFSDFGAKALAQLIPDKTTRILIYCNNNFEGDKVNFAGKGAPVALNIPTFVNLHAYGYTNVFELKPYLHLKTTVIPFAGSETKTVSE